MAGSGSTTQSLGTASRHEATGFPPFKTQTYPGQLFWLAITFGFLFLVLWRMAGPRIHGVIANRRRTINTAIDQARTARTDAQTAQSDYETALAQARVRAGRLAEETRQRLNAEIAHAKAEADAQAHAAMAEAETQIAQTRQNAKAAVRAAARDAAIAIVEHLTGDKVSAEDAVQAIGS